MAADAIFKGWKLSSDRLREFVMILKVPTSGNFFQNKKLHKKRRRRFSIVVRVCVNRAENRFENGSDRRNCDVPRGIFEVGDWSWPLFKAQKWSTTMEISHSTGKKLAKKVLQRISRWKTVKLPRFCKFYEPKMCQFLDLDYSKLAKKQIQRLNSGRNWHISTS